MNQGYTYSNFPCFSSLFSLLLSPLPNRPPPLVPNKAADFEEEELSANECFMQAMASTRYKSRKDSMNLFIVVVTLKASKL